MNCPRSHRASRLAGAATDLAAVNGVGLPIATYVDDDWASSNRFTTPT